MKRKEEDVSSYAKRIRTAVYQNMDESFRVQTISQILNIPIDQIKACKYNYNNTYMWRYHYNNKDFKTLVDLVNEWYDHKSDRKLDILADVSQNENATTSSNIFAEFNKFLHQKQSPTSEDELIACLKTFTCEVWIPSCNGNLTDVKNAFEVFKTIYLYENFAAFLKD